MTDTDHRRFHRRFDRIERKLPNPLSRALRWLRSPSAKWVRVPVGVLFAVGGLLGFLPILGFWMLPVGILLLAQDIPALKRPTGRAMVWIERKWTGWRRRGT